MLEDVSVSRLSEQIQYYHDEAAVLTVLRDGQEISVNIEPAYDKESKMWLLGFDLTSKVEKISKLESFKVATQQLGEYSTMIIRSVAKLIQGIGLSSVSGPVGIYQVTAETASMGLLPFLSLLALFSLNIGIFNLLPIPVLDGGRIVIVLVEKICRRKLNERVLNAVMLGSFALVIGLMLFATFNDVIRLF